MKVTTVYKIVVDLLVCETVALLAIPHSLHITTLLKLKSLLIQPHDFYGYHNATVN